MDAMERRVFLKGASMGMLAFTVGGADILMTPGEARARAVPFRMLNGEEAETLEALGETLVPGAREAGVAHFIDQQVSVPPGEALLEARIVNVKPPFINFYRARDRRRRTRRARRAAANASPRFRRRAARLHRSAPPEQDRRLAGSAGRARSISCCAATPSMSSTAPWRATRASASPICRTSHPDKRW